MSKGKSAADLASSSRTTQKARGKNRELETRMSPPAHTAGRRPDPLNDLVAQGLEHHIPAAERYWRIAFWIKALRQLWPLILPLLAWLLGRPLLFALVFAHGVLAPADTKKDRTAFDLPIALGLLVATGQLRVGATEGIVALGELGLDGSIRPVRGVLPVARLLARVNNQTLVVPAPNVPEGALVSSLKLGATSTLAELVDALRREQLPVRGNARTACAWTL